MPTYTDMYGVRRNQQGQELDEWGNDVAKQKILEEEEQRRRSWRQENEDEDEDEEDEEEEEVPVAVALRANPRSP